MIAVLQPLQGRARQISDAAKSAERDGQHGMLEPCYVSFPSADIEVKIALTGFATSVEYEGSTFVRKVWDGRANLAELEVDGPAGHLEVLSLRLYDSQASQ
jgi:hypothetical protein